MVLNIPGFSSHIYHFHICEMIPLIVAIILEIASSLCLNSVKILCAGQCLLYAKVFERARILQGSNTTWCHLPLVFNFVAGSISLFLFRFISRGRSRLVSSQDRVRYKNHCKAPFWFVWMSRNCESCVLKAFVDNRPTAVRSAQDPKCRHWVTLGIWITD